MTEVALLTSVAHPERLASSSATNMEEQETPPWKTIVAAKQIRLQAAIPEEWRIPAHLFTAVDLSLESTQSLVETPILRNSKIMSNRELGITEDYSAVQLLAKLAAGELSALEVTLAFSKRAAIAQQLLSCLTEMFFDVAQERARFLDSYLAEEGNAFGPLHGLPISLKDSFNIVGIQSTIGYVSFLGHPIPAANAALVDLLLGLGAVLYVKSNIPQTLMTADSENNIFGRTRNPRKLNLTAGGSSGGEGSLIAFRGSLLGVGTDVAGSIRIPALCCGIYGFKPTASRVPYGGQASPSLAGLPGIVPSAGPLAASMGDLKLFFKTVLDAQPWKMDASSLGIPFQIAREGEDIRTKPVMRIGVMPEDPNVPLHPPVRRALENAVAALSSAGHTIVSIEFGEYTSVLNGNDLSMKFLAIDPTNTSFKHISASGEPMIATVAAKPPNRLTPSVYGIADLAELNVKRSFFQNFWRTIFCDNQLDFVIGPGAQHTAPKHDTYGKPAYTVFWNLLDYPACIIPYGRASKILDSNESVASSGSPKYDAEAFDGAPTAVQIVAQRFQDELCLEASTRVNAILNGSSP